MNKLYYKERNGKIVSIDFREKKLNDQFEYDMLYQLTNKRPIERARFVLAFLFDTYQRAGIVRIKYRFQDIARVIGVSYCSFSAIAGKLRQEGWKMGGNEIRKPINYDT